MASEFREGRSLLRQLGLILIPLERNDRLAAVAVYETCASLNSAGYLFEVRKGNRFYDLE